MNKQQKIIFIAALCAAFAGISFALVFRMQARAVTEAATRAIEMLEEETSGRGPRCGGATGFG